MKLNIDINIFNENKSVNYNIYANQVVKIEANQYTYGFNAEIEFVLFENYISDEFLNILYSNELLYLNLNLDNKLYYKSIITLKEILQIRESFRKYKFIITDIAKGYLSNIYIKKIYKGKSFKNIISQNINDNIDIKINSEFFDNIKDIVNVHSLSFYDFIVYICKISSSYFLYNYHNGEYLISESLDSLDSSVMNKYKITKDEFISFKNSRQNNLRYNLKTYINSNNNYFDLSNDLFLNNVYFNLENKEIFSKKMQGIYLIYELINLDYNSEYNYSISIDSNFSIDCYKYYNEYKAELESILPDCKKKKYNLSIKAEINIGQSDQDLKKYNLIEKEDGVYCSVFIPDLDISIPAKFSPHLNSNVGFIPPYNKQKVLLNLELFNAEINSYLDFRISNKPDFDSSDNVLDLSFSNNMTASISSSIKNENAVLKISQVSKEIRNIIEMSDEGLNISLEYE